MFPLLLLHFTVGMTAVTFLFQRKEEKKTKWSLAHSKAGLLQGGCWEVSLSREWGKFPNRCWSSSLGRTFLFIFLNDPWLCPARFFAVYCARHIWNGSWVLFTPGVLPGDRDIHSPLPAWGGLKACRVFKAFLIQDCNYFSKTILSVLEKASDLFSFRKLHVSRPYSSFLDTISKLFIYFIASSPLHLFLFFSLMVATMRLSKSRWEDHNLNLIFAKDLSHGVQPRGLTGSSIHDVF